MSSKDGGFLSVRLGAWIITTLLVALLAFDILLAVLRANLLIVLMLAGLVAVGRVLRWLTR